MKAARAKGVRRTIAMFVLAAVGLGSLGASFGCDTSYDPYWDINSVAWYRQAETDFWADQWDWLIRNG